MPSMPSAQVNAAEQRDFSTNCHCGAAGVVIGPQIEAEREVDQRRDQRDPARAIGA